MLTDKVLDDALLIAIENGKLERKHASAWNWHDKKEKELGIVDSFLNPINHIGIHDYVEFAIPESDPPDALIYNAYGDEVLLEIVELVNRDAIDSQIQDKPDYWEQCAKWTDLDYFESNLNGLILEKNEKCTHLFDQNRNVQLLIHTNEKWLEAYYKQHLDAANIPEEHDFTSVWLMLGYSTAIKAYPIIPVC